MDTTLATLWIQEQLSYNDKKENTPAIQEVIELGLHAPTKLWTFILSVIEENGNDEVLNILGAGPLEDLVIEYGIEYYDRIAEQYRRSPRFRRALASVWIGDDKKKLVPLYSNLGCQIIAKGDA